MAFREDTKVTPAEALSFDMVPETCPAIEAAFEKLNRGPARWLVDAELRSYGIEPTEQMFHAIAAITAKATNGARHELRTTVLMQGTFPLRLALVQMIERTLPPGQPESRYARWLRAQQPTTSGAPA
jgi:hypothetical protein